jgi:hypothetical protein
MFSFAASTATFFFALLIGLSLDGFHSIVFELVGGIASFVAIDLFLLSRLDGRPRQQCLRGVLQALIVLGSGRSDSQADLSLCFGALGCFDCAA